MHETYYAGAYWLARHETAGACARRAQDFFRGLSVIEPTWRRWHETADSFEEARNLQVNPDAATFKTLFARKKNQLGDSFRFWLWAGDHPNETTSVDALCGSAADWQPSTCVLDPPAQGAVARRVLTAPVMTGVIRAMAMAWEPEWAVATSVQHRAAVSQRPKPGTFVGWVMYFSHQRGAVPPLPAPVRLEPVEDRGMLVTLTPDLFSFANPDHVALAARVQELLGEAGLLRPLQPVGS
jgi:hypothetical protein